MRTRARPNPVNRASHALHPRFRPLERFIDPRQLGPREWNRLCSIAGLTAEDWGEAWIALEQAHRQNEGGITEPHAIRILTRIAERTKAESKLLQTREWRAVA